MTRAVAAWQGDRWASRERSSDLVELLAPAPELRLRRRTARAFEEITDEVADRLEAASGTDRLPEHEKLAALAEVEAARIDADLSDEALFAVDVDPTLLARRLRQDSAARIRTAGLSEVATRSTNGYWTTALAAWSPWCSSCRHSTPVPAPRP